MKKVIAIICSILSAIILVVAVFELDESIYQSIQKIEESFYDLGYQFWTIRISNNTICFDTVSGEYDIIYSIDGISPKEKGMDTDGDYQYISSKIMDNWYHRCLE